MDLIFAIFYAAFYVLVVFIATFALPFLIIGFFAVSAVLLGETMWKLLVECIKDKKKRKNEED